MTETAEPDNPATGQDIQTEIKTFMISDVRGYTRFTQEHGDEAGARLAARFAALTRDAVAARGGRVIELRGDEALAVFSSARQAVRAAVDLQVRLAQEAMEDPSLPIPVGIGLDAGEAIPVEGGYRGGALNLAARLCSLAGPGDVLISEGLVHLARKIEGLAYVERGFEQLKGLSEPVRVIAVVPEGEVVAEQSPANAGARLPVGNFLGALPSGKMVAREEEMRQISEGLKGAAEGEGSLVLIAGEQGVGKTRLAQEASVEARSRGFLPATGRCYESQRALPYYPFLEALAQLLHAAPPALRSSAGRRWPHLARLLPEEFTSSPTPATDPQEEQARLYRAVTGFVIACSESAPVALLLDDLQWADERSLDLLAHLARNTRANRVLLLGTYLDADVSTETRLGRVVRELSRERLLDRITLHRLSTEGTAALMSSLMGESVISPELVELVQRRTRGRPFFVEEMVRALGGRYQLVRELGAGGMGRVFQAVDTRDDSPVAVKILFASSDAGIDALLRFQQEGAVLSTLKHPNIVEVKGTFLEEYISCIIMELLDGRSLGQVMRTEELSLARIKRILSQVAAALTYAHGRNIVHRDIKPDNIMVVGEDAVKVTDFGIARVLGAGATLNTATGMGIGTPLYMAPEQIEGTKVDGRADIYSLGAVLYQLVTGRPPFDGGDPITTGFKHLREAPKPPTEIAADLPPDWEDLILTMLAKDPNDRFKTARELEEAVAQLSTEPVMPGARSRVRRTPTPKPTPGESAPIFQPARVRIPTPPPIPGAPAAREIGSRLSRLPRWALATAGGVLALIVVATVFIARGGSSATPPPKGLATVAGWGSIPPVTFNTPDGIASDRQGNIYVTDEFANTVDKISPDGVLLGHIGSKGTGPGQLSLPNFVAVDRAGDVYVSDTGNNRLEKFLPGGKTAVDFLNMATGPLATDSQGNVYADFNLGADHGVYEYTAKGTPVTHWGPAGKFSAAKFPIPVSIAIDSLDRLYVVDAGLHSSVLYVFTAKGTPLRHINLPPDMSAAIQQGATTSIGVDDSGDTYIAIAGSIRRIFRVTPSGAIRSWLKTGGPGEIKALNSIVVGTDGNVYALDSSANRVRILSPTGRTLAQWGGHATSSLFRAPAGVSVDSQGTVYVADTADNRIGELSAAGELLHTWTDHFNSPQAVVADSGGNIYVADQNNSRVVKLSPTGRPIAPWGTGASGPNTLNAPYALAFDRDGNLWVMDGNTPTLHEFSPDGKLLKQAQPGNAPGTPFGGLAFDDRGNLVVTGGSAPGVSVFATALLNPNHPTDPIATYGGFGSQRGQFRSPSGIALDRQGDMYVADTGNHRIVALSPSGKFLFAAGSQGAAPGSFSSPVGMAVDGRGNVYVADTNNDRVQKLVPRTR